MFGTPTRTAFDMRNQRDIGDINVPLINSKLVAFDLHVSGAATQAHTVSNIDGLQTKLDNKSQVTHTHTGVYQPVISGYSGIIPVITSVNFTDETTDTSNLTYDNGILIGVS